MPRYRILIAHASSEVISCANQRLGMKLRYIMHCSPAYRLIVLKRTPMFMARALCLHSPALYTLHTWFKGACKGVFPEGVTGVTQRQKEVTAFLRLVDELGDNSDECAQESVVHAPIHDAESIFWLIVLFFLRAWPKGYDPKSDPNEPKRRRARTGTFESFVRNEIGQARTAEASPEYICFLLNFIASVIC